MTLDYAAEVIRTRTAQGLPADVPGEVRDAVAALLGAERSVADRKAVQHDLAA